VRGWPVVAAIAAFIALLVLLIVVSRRRERRRREALREWAAANGWEYAQRPAAPWQRRLPRRGARRAVSLALTGPLGGYPVTVADYSYTETHTQFTTGVGGAGSTSTTRTHHFVVVVVRLPWSAPAVAVHPRRGLSRLARAVFGEGRTALGNEAFDRAYRVATREPEAARRLIGPALIAEHLAGRAPAWSLDGADLLTYRRGRLGDPAEIPSLARPLVRVASLLGR
jgi:hypothetical protein